MPCRRIAGDREPMTRRTAKVTMLPSQGISAKLAGVVLPVLEKNNAKNRPLSPLKQGQVRRLDRRPAQGSDAGGAGTRSADRPCVRTRRRPHAPRAARGPEAVPVIKPPRHLGPEAPLIGRSLKPRAGGLPRVRAV